MIGRIFALSAIGGFLIGILPVEAGGTVPGSMPALVPEEWQRSVIMGELPPCTETGDCCGIHRECCPDCDTSRYSVAPVPLNGTGLFIMSALVAVAALKLNVKGRYK